MLFSWLTLALVAYVAKGQEMCFQSGTVQTVDGTHNYVIDFFNGNALFAYAINQCTQVNLFNSEKWFTYTCSSDKTSVVRKGYSDASCTTASTVQSDSMTFTAQGVPTGHYGDFECDGTDSYGKITASTSSDCGNAITVYAAVSACTTPVIPQLGQASKFYCDSSGGVLQYMAGVQTTTPPPVPGSTDVGSHVQAYMSSDVVGPTQPSGGGDVCSSTKICNTWSFTGSSGCKEVTPLGGGIYGGLTECKLTFTDDGKAASTQFAVMNLFLALISLVWFF